MDAIATIDQNKRACTGVGLVLNARPDLVPSVDSEAAFSALASDYYMVFREALAPDVAFLRGVEQHSVIREFDQAIYRIRTAHQHHDNEEATAFLKDWLSVHPGWQVSADALAHLFGRALEELARISGKARRDPSLAAAWRDRTTVEPAAIFEAVCADLAVTFNEGLQAILVRNVERRARRIRPGQDARSAVQGFCAEEITSQNRRLPVSYFAILDRLGLLGHRRARAALLLAYSIAASSDLRGEAFMRRVEDAWKVVSA